MNNEEKILSILMTMQTDISELKTDVSVLKTDVAELKTDVAVLKTDVAGLKTDVSVLKTDVAGLKTDVSVLKTDVAGLKTDVSVLKTDVTNLQQGQLRIEKKIDQLASIQNDDVVALVKNTNEIRQNVKSIQTDVFYLAEKTLDNSKQILRLAE